MIIHPFTEHIIEEIQKLEDDKSAKISNLDDLWKRTRNIIEERFNADSSLFSSLGLGFHHIETAGINMIDRVVESYCNGDVSGALQIVKDLLFDSKTGKYNFSTYSWGKVRRESGVTETVSYRMRANENYERYTREELFHAPFNNLKNVGTQRYSMIGFPCLYLGESLYNCWEEIKRPDLEKVNFARFVHYEKLELLDLVFPSDYKSEKDFVQAAIVMMCSKSVIDDNAKFKYEYVFPQLILQSMIENKRYKGIRYLSTKFISGKSLFPNNADIMMNYVIPVEKVTSSTKYCKGLSSIFKLTEPKAYFVDFLRDNLPGVKVRATGYQGSVLFAYEEQLKTEDLKHPTYI